MSLQGFQVLFEAPAEVCVSLEDGGLGFEGCFRLVRHPSGDVRGFLCCDVDIYPFLAPDGIYVVRLEQTSLELVAERTFKFPGWTRDRYLRFPAENDAQTFARVWGQVLGK